MKTDEKLTVEKIWEYYDNSTSYLNTIGLTKNLPMYNDYYEGRQWKKIEKGTESLPRPVVNIISFVCDTKESSILSKPYRIVYKSNKLAQAQVDKFNHFGNYIQSRMHQEEKDAESVNMFIKEGSGFLHYYYNVDKKDSSNKFGGSLECELIDPLDIRFEDPKCQDVQKQKWILIISRQSVDSLKAQADEDVEQELITSDKNDSPYNTKEQDGSELATTITIYYRANDEVYVAKAVKGTFINKPRPFTPDIEGAMYQIRNAQNNIVDAEDNDQPDLKEKENTTNTSKATLYPIVCGFYKKRKGSIYGIGVVEDLMSIQRSINNNLALALYAFQQTAFGKFVVHPDNRNEKITNSVNEVLVDKTKTMTGYKVVQGQQMPNSTILVDYLINVTRTFKGVTQVTTGEILKSGMSGAAIARLQESAEATMENARKNFRLFKKQQGEVLAQFYKFYYTNEEFYFDDDENKKTITDNFSSVEYRDINFEVVAETTIGTYSSVAGDINMLDTLLKAGAITIQDYIKCYPSDALTNKTELLNAIQNKTEEEIKQLIAQNTELTKELENAAKLIQEQQQVVNRAIPIIKENNALKQQYMELYIKSKESIENANKQILEGNQMIENLMSDEKNKKLFESLKDNKMFAEYINKHNASE